jgi:hypothetical protein
VRERPLADAHAECDQFGIVERCKGFFETAFMPGRDFRSPADFLAGTCVFDSMSLAATDSS